MTLENYQALWDAQEGLCAICKTPERATSRAGAVRLLTVDPYGEALLCSVCVDLLDKAKRNPARLRAMADYIESHGGIESSNVTVW